MRILLASGLCAIVGFLLAAPAGAAATATGTFRVVSIDSTSTQVVHGTTVDVYRQTVLWTGPINGTAQETLYNKVLPSGASVFWGFDVCTCSGGTLTFGFAGAADAAGVFGGFLATTGGTAPVRGAATFQGSVGADGLSSGTYTGVFSQRRGDR